MRFFEVLKYSDGDYVQKGGLLGAAAAAAADDDDKVSRGRRHTLLFHGKIQIRHNQQRERDTVIIDSELDSYH
jgi:hypothetical protein